MIEAQRPPTGARRLALATALTYGLGAVASGGGGLAMAPIVGLAGLIAAPWKPAGSRLRRPSAALWLAIALIAWLALSLIWTPTPNAAERFAKALASVGGGLLLILASHTRATAPAAWVARAGVALLAALLMIEAAFGLPLNRLAQPNAAADWLLARNAAKGAAILTLFIWGATLGLARGVRGQALIAIGAATSAAALGWAFDMGAASVAAILGLSAWMLGLFAPRWAVRIVAGVVAALILAAPLVGAQLSALAGGEAQALPFSWRDRLDIWASAAGYIGDRPILGHGFDAARAFPTAQIVEGAARAAIPLPPHNLGLQLWLEGGAPAVLVAAALALLVGERAARGADRATMRAIASLGAAWTTFAALSFGAWQEWWIASFAAAVALVALNRPRQAL
ncbi:MAG: O-antigen ligase family protein [Caulobacterales bacterium]